MKIYLEYLEDILTNGVVKKDRTGVGTVSVFGRQLRFDLAKGFPLLTTKKVFFKGVLVELLWFLRGETSLDYLRKHDVHIWDGWAQDGELGPVYGRQWRSWPTPDGRHVDQIEQVLRDLNTNPDSRRIIVSAWNVADLPNESVSPQENVRNGKMALAPCHAFFQFYSAPMTDYERAIEAAFRGVAIGEVPRRKLSCQLYQRSVDSFLGLGFNIPSYSLLTMLIAERTGHAYGDFVWVGGDCHIYLNHLEQAREQIRRKPRALPTLRLLEGAREKPLEALEIEDFVLEGYDPHPPIKASVAI